MKEVPAEEKGKVGAMLNTAKIEVESLIKNKEEAPIVEMIFNLFSKFTKVRFHGRSFLGITSFGFVSSLISASTTGV